MAVHVPLSNAAILEAQLLMLASHNILNPANGAPITVPSQDMVLGLYYLTKGRKLLEMKSFAEKEKYFILRKKQSLLSTKKVDLHANVKCRVRIKEGDEFKTKIIETTVGRVVFNEVVPRSQVISTNFSLRKILKNVIGDVLVHTNIPTTAKFLDDIKELGIPGIQRWFVI